MTLACITNQVLMIKSMEDENTRRTEQHRPENNLIPRPWPAGVSGNPKGRPKGSGLKLDDLLNEMLEREINIEQIIKDKKAREALGLGSKARVADAVTAILLRQAFEGKKYALEMLFERNSGKAKQDVTVNQGEVSSMTDAQLDDRLAELLGDRRLVDVSDALTQPEVGINAAIDGVIPGQPVDVTPMPRVNTIVHDDDSATVAHETVDNGAAHG